jgi:hypothetical protein
MHYLTWYVANVFVVKSIVSPFPHHCSQNMGDLLLLSPA